MKKVDQQVFHNVWESARKSIWATNTPAAKFGRSTDPEIIKKQRAAMNRGVTVTRVFVLEPTDDEQERSNVGMAMLLQREAGIRVFQIDRSILDEVVTEAKQFFGSSDFVIVDGELVFVTDESTGEKTLFDSPEAARRALATASFIEQEASCPIFEDS